MSLSRAERPSARRRVWVEPKPRVAVELTGSGPLVLFLHGIGGNRTNWYPQLDVVGAEFTAAAWDARGYGESDDYEGELDFADFSGDLLRVLDAFDAHSAHLVGVSMGGRIAIDFVGRHPDRVATLTLADTSAGSARVASPAEVEKFLQMRKQPLLEGRSPQDIAPEVVATLIGPATPAAVRDAMIESLSVLHRDSYLKTLDAVTRYTAFTAFEKIKVPTLVIVGEHDRIATPEYAAAMAQRIENSRFVMLEGGSHISNMDRPAEFNAVLLDFLRTHAARALPRGAVAATMGA